LKQSGLGVIQTALFDRTSYWSLLWI